MRFRLSSAREPMAAVQVTPASRSYSPPAMAHPLSVHSSAIVKHTETRGTMVIYLSTELVRCIQTDSKQETGPLDQLCELEPLSSVGKVKFVAPSRARKISWQQVKKRPGAICTILYLITLYRTTPCFLPRGEKDKRKTRS